MRRSNFPLRLASSLLEEARRVADSEGVALNQLINIAVAEKISTLRTEDFFRERSVRANVLEALRILDQAGSVPPQPGDEVASGSDPIPDQVLTKAIRTKHLIRFRYKTLERIVEPHDYGIQKGITRLLSWQIGGQSSGRLPGWRWFDVADMRDIEMLDKTFAGNREVPSGKHHRWDEVFIRVAPPNDR